MTKEDDLDSLWAALTLARRGDKKVVPRIIELIDKDISTNERMSATAQALLRKRVTLLFSNSAVASGVPQLSDYYEAKISLAASMRKWWKANSEKIQLADPWLKELAEQRID